MTSPADQWRTFLRSDATVEIIARHFHMTYELLAPLYGYETREESAVPWDDVPEANRRLMVETVRRCLSALALASTDSGDPNPPSSTDSSTDKDKNDA